MKTELEFRFHKAVAEISAKQWNVLAADRSPFLRHEFLNALETTGCANVDTGWQPWHLGVYEKDSVENGLIAVVPLYLKSHSYGEYVFDWSWADAYRQHAMRYYPKLVTSVPFTPSSAARFLMSEETDQQALTIAIAEAVIAEATRIDASSWHVLFPTKIESDHLVDSKVRQRIATQFHWYNRDYTSFDHFLDAFNSRKRKNLRKEREAVRSQDIHFQRFEGHQITGTLWQEFYRFYQNTYQVRGQHGYLTSEFFQRIGEVMPDNILLVVATLHGRNIAAALSFKDIHKLYGRYWGCLEEYQFLHFETCYYQGIEYAIEHQLKSFDSGAQGEHKIQRGFEPIITYSNHWIADPRFDEAIGDFLAKEAEHVEGYRSEAETLLPFKVC